MKNNEQKRQNIIQILKTSKKITIEQGIKVLGVSESTVRRLFAQLENEGIAIRTYGGICYRENDFNGYSYSFDSTKLLNSDKKERIGIMAEKLIHEGDIIYLDSGTTVMSLCNVIENMFSDAAAFPDSEKSAALRKRYENIAVFTHSLVNLNLLMKYMKVYLIGGEYRNERRDFCGYLTEEAIKGLRFTKCFIGADGYSEETGLLASDFGTARVNQLVAQNSSYRILLADSSKFGASSVVCYSPLSDINCIVSDNGLPEDICEKFRHDGIEVITD